MSRRTRISVILVFALSIAVCNPFPASSTAVEMSNVQLSNVQLSNVTPLSNAATTYFSSLATSNPYSGGGGVTGTLSGAMTNSNVDVKNYAYNVNATFSGPFGTEGGFQSSLAFGVEGSIAYTYSTPFSLSNISMPSTVYAGQRIYINPTFSLGGLTWSANQSAEFYTSTHNAFNVPADGLGWFSLDTKQKASTMDISASLPGAFGFDGLSGSATVPSPGQLSNDQYSITMGGDVTINNSSTSSLAPGFLGDEVKSSIDGQAVDGWSTGVDAWWLTGDILSKTGVPYPVAVGEAMLVLDNYLDIDVDLSANLNIQRDDSLAVRLTSLPYIDIPTDIALGAYDDQALTITIPYEVVATSFYEYPVTISATFDMIGIDPYTLLNPTVGVWEGESVTYDQDFTSAAGWTADFTVVDRSDLSYGELGISDAQYLRAVWSPEHSVPSDVLSSTQTINTNLAYRVPEPATLLLFGAGLFGIGIVRKKKLLE